jgi:hypothetical protein
MDLRHAPEIQFVHDWKQDRDDIKQREFRSALRTFRKQRRALRLSLLQRKGVAIPEEYLPHMKLHEQIVGRAEQAGMQLAAGEQQPEFPDELLEQIERLEKLPVEQRELELETLAKAAFHKR